MLQANQFERETARTLNHLLLPVEESASNLISADPEGWLEFRARLGKYFPALFDLCLQLYGGHYDFFYHVVKNDTD